MTYLLKNKAQRNLVVSLNIFTVRSSHYLYLIKIYLKELEE